MFVVWGRGTRDPVKLLNALFELEDRSGVCFGRFVTPLLETVQVVGGDGSLEHVIGSGTYRVTTPSIGLLAVAYRFR